MEIPSPSKLGGPKVDFSLNINHGVSLVLWAIGGLGKMHETKEFPIYINQFNKELEWICITYQTIPK